MLSAKFINSIKHGGFRSFVRRAVDLGVQIDLVFEKPRVIKLQHKKTVAYCVGDCIPTLRRSSNVATKNKSVTKAVLASAGIATPAGIEAGSYQEAKKKIVLAHLAYPLIAKPLDQSFAHGVTWNIKTAKELAIAVAHIKKTSLKTQGKQMFLIEEMAPGDEYRIIVFNGRVLSCVRKVPATVIGDGHSDITGLIKGFNKTRMHGFEIKVDKVVKHTLKKNGLALSSVLPKDHVLKLRNNLNMSDGGRSIDFTARMSTHLKAVSVRAVEALGMNFAGIDLITPNISASEERYSIIEINSLPYFNMNERPLVEGKGSDISGSILKSLFPTLSLQGKK